MLQVSIVLVDSIWVQEIIVQTHNVIFLNVFCKIGYFEKNILKNSQLKVSFLHRSHWLDIAYVLYFFSTLIQWWKLTFKINVSLAALWLTHLEIILINLWFPTWMEYIKFILIFKKDNSSIQWNRGQKILTEWRQEHCTAWRRPSVSTVYIPSKQLQAPERRWACSPFSRLCTAIRGC